METAKEFLQRKVEELHIHFESSEDFDDTCNAMIEFAKMHVEECKKEILNICTDYKIE